jgi:PAT family acetyl-CoA transporter-like MFS transporter 1
VQPSLAGDWHNMLVLLGLYTLQGIPIGLASSVPLFLMSRGASFSDQATFSLASWPYSLKLLWAPIVDALYTQRWHLGQRKSWIVPVQFVTGIIMIILGVHVDDVFGSAPEASAKEGGRIDVASLTASFFLLYLLVATQDIAVDGWALTMLRPENVGYASTANTVGQTVGITAAYGLLMALDSPDFCNAWIRAPLGWPSVEVSHVHARCLVSSRLLRAGPHSQYSYCWCRRQAL